MTKFCPECGFKQHNDDNHFCSNCGYDLSKLEKDGSGLNISDGSEDTSVNVPIDDLEDSEGSKPFDSRTVVSGSDSSKPVSPKPTVSSSDSSKPVSPKPTVSSSDSSKPVSPKPTVSGSDSSKPKTTVIKSSSNSNNQTRTNKGTRATNQSDFLSNLSFNKCFLAFAILLIIMVIIGMLSQTTEREPYSDDGLTSFMESSYNYGSIYMSDILNSNDDFNYDDFYDNLIYNDVNY